MEIDLRNVAGAETISADLEDVVVVGKIVFCQLQHRLRLQRGHKCAAQVEEQSSLQVGVTRLSDQSPFFCALQAQLSLVPPFVQIADAGRLKGPAKGRQ